MPKKSNKGKNSFYFFMLDWKKRQEAAGRTFPNGLKDVQSDEGCSREWREMTNEEKNYYVSQSKDHRIASQMRMEKVTNTGESIRQIEEDNKKRQQFEQTMQQFIESIVTMGMRHNNLGNLKFIFFHVNWFFIRETEQNKPDYFPAEFAVAEFSLENGIGEIYHEIVSEKIPLGMRRDAMETSQQTHRITVELPDGENNYSVMFDKFLSFLQSRMINQKLPPLYTLTNLRDAADSLLNKFTEAGNVSKDMFTVYSIEELFKTMRNAVIQTASLNERIPVVVALDEFQKNPFSTIQGIECDFHKNIDGTSQYCSKAIVKQWGFIMCDHCCQFLDIEMCPGIHHPSTSVPDENDITLNFSQLNLNNPLQLLSMSGVSEEYRIKVSGRSYQEEQRRRTECKPIKLIDHGQKNGNSMLDSLNVTPTVRERPLRPPRTPSNALLEISGTSNGLSLDKDFPAIGNKGIGRKKEDTEIKLPLGRGCWLRK